MLVGTPPHNLPAVVEVVLQMDWYRLVKKHGRLTVTLFFVQIEVFASVRGGAVLYTIKMYIKHPPQYSFLRFCEIIQEMILACISMLDQENAFRLR